MTGTSLPEFPATAWGGPGMADGTIEEADLDATVAEAIVLAGTAVQPDDATQQITETATALVVADATVTTAENAVFTATPDPVWVTAKVEPAGTIQLMAAGEPLGSATALTSGEAEITIPGATLGEGTHSVIAVFTPTASTPWQSSTSTAVTVTVTAA